MTSPMSGGSTPLYGLKYIVQGQPARFTRQYLEENAKSIEAALSQFVPNPNVQNLNAEVSARQALDARVVKLETKGRAHLYATAAQTGLATGYATITLDSETVDTLGGHAQGAAGYTVPAGAGGLWLVSASVGIGAVGTGNSSGVTVGGRIMVNGAAQVASPPTVMPVSSQNGDCIPLPGRLVSLNAGDVVTLQGYVNTGGWSTLASASAGATTSTLTLVQL